MRSHLSRCMYKRQNGKKLIREVGGVEGVTLLIIFHFFTSFFFFFSQDDFATSTTSAAQAATPPPKRPLGHCTFVTSVDILATDGLSSQSPSVAKAVRSQLESHPGSL